MMLAKSADGGQTFSAPVKLSDYYDTPNCDTYQGDGADPGRACVPEKGSSTKSVFRTTNYPSGQVDPRNPNVVTVAFGSYINPDSNEGNGCVPTGFEDGNPTYTGVKTPGACNNKILLKVSTQRRRLVRRLDRSAPRPGRQPVVRAAANGPVLPVERVHPLGQAGRRLLRPPVRQRRDDGILGLQPVRER